MSEGNSVERRKILQALGAEIILTKQVEGAPGMVTGKDIAYAAQVANDYAIAKDAFYVDQFNNPSSVLAHYYITGPEIWNDLPEIEAFVSVIGSGGTFLGTSQYLKEKNSKIQCIAVEPENAAILKTGKVLSSQHIIQGTGYGIVPPHWDKKWADSIITVADDEVRRMTRTVSQEHGLFVGYSSGANVMAARKFLDNHPHIKNIVTILCDTGYKYSDL